jgi:hypothetical protein
VHARTSGHATRKADTEEKPTPKAWRSKKPDSWS